MNNSTQRPAKNNLTVTGTFTRLAPWTLGARLVVMVMAIVATSVLTRTMTQDQWSKYSLLKNMWWYVWLLGQMGLCDASLRFGAELSAQGDTHKFRKLLIKILSIQALAIGGMLLMFILLRGWLDTMFCVNFGFALIMMVILGGVTIFKETLRQGYVAAYWIKLVALMSVVGAVAFPVSSYIFIVKYDLGATGGLAGEAVGYVLMILVFSVGMIRLKFRRTAPESSAEPVTNYRVFRYSGAMLSNHLLTLMLGPQVVVFLVGYFLRSEEGAVGIYSLASVVPRQGLTFLTLAIIPLITAVLTKAYYQDKTRFPELTRSYFKLIIIMVLPLVAGGLIFVDKALEVLSGERGMEAGRLATALLPLQLINILILPIAAGLRVHEKAHRMIIPRIFSGIVGVGVVAASLILWSDLWSVVAAGYIRAFFITPIVMIIAARLIGGLYFPFKFFGRAVLACLPVGLLYPLRFLWPHAWKFGEDLVGNPAVGGLIFLIGAGIVSVLILVLSSRLFGLFGPEEIKYFRNAKFPGVNSLMKILVQKRYLK